MDGKLVTIKIDHREPLRKEVYEQCEYSTYKYLCEVLDDYHNKLEAAKKALFYIKYRCKEDDSAYKRVTDVLNKAIKTLEDIE